MNETYIVIREEYLNDLIETVNNKMKCDGYIPVGGVSECKCYWVQAMVLKEYKE